VLAIIRYERLGSPEGELALFNCDAQWLAVREQVLLTEESVQ